MAATALHDRLLIHVTGGHAFGALRRVVAALRTSDFEALEEIDRSLNWHAFADTEIAKRLVSGSAAAKVEASIGDKLIK
jgi:hypothetical protein